MIKPFTYIFFVIAFICTILPAKTLDAFSHKLIKIRLDSSFTYKHLVYLGFDIETSRLIDSNTITLIADKYECRNLEKLNAKFEIIEDNLDDSFSILYNNWLNSDKNKLNYQLNENFATGSMGGYFTLEETYAQYDSLFIKYSDFAGYSDTIGYTFNNRPIIVYCFGECNNPNNEVLMTSLIHAREPGGASVIIYFLKDLLSKAKAGNDEAGFLLANRTLYVIPVMNPDGLSYNQTIRPQGGGLWRKNRFMIDDTTFGIDLNRNFGPLEFWDAPIGGSSDKPSETTYRGITHFSELETQALRDFVLSKNIRIALNYHTYSNLLIYPYSAMNSETEDSLFYRDLAHTLTKKNNYLFGLDKQTVNYNSRGSSDDWFYWTDNTKQTKTFAFTPEIGRLSDNFWTTPDRQLIHCLQNLNMNYQTLWSADINWQAFGIYYSNNESSNQITLEYRNVGVNDANTKPEISIKSLSKEFSLDSNPESENFSNNHYSHSYKFSIDKEAKNGSELIVAIEITQNGIIRHDTLVTYVWQPDEIVLFRNGKPNASWDYNNWSGEYNLQAERFILSDSPDGLYPNKDTNYLTMNDRILLDFNNAILCFRAYWEIEPNFDFATVEISTDNGSTWVKLTTNYMTAGGGQKGHVISIDEWGFTGYSKTWKDIRIPLTQYLGQKIRLRFGMLSDLASNLNGILLDDIHLKVYSDILSINNNFIDNLNIYPNPVNENQHITIEVPEGLQIKNIEIFDVLGNRLKGELDRNSNKLYLHNLKTGVYIIKTLINQEVRFNKIILK